MPKKESKFVDNYFSKPWIQHVLATFDPRKVEVASKPDNFVAQIINAKEGCPDGLGEIACDIFASSDFHDGHVRTTALFTKEAIEVFEKLEESLSGCEFEHLPNAVLLLQKFKIIPKITKQLCDCQLFVCIESFVLWTSEGPAFTTSYIPWARSSQAVLWNIQRLWIDAQGSSQEDSGNEALTDSDVPFSCDDLSQLLAEVKKDSMMLQSSNSNKESQLSVANQSLCSPKVVSVTSSPGPAPPDPDSLGPASLSNHLTPEEVQNPDGRKEPDEAQGSTSKVGGGGGEQIEEEEGLKWRHVDQLVSWVFEVRLPSSSTCPSDAEEDRMKAVVERVTECLKKLPERGEEEEESSYESIGMQGERSQDLSAKRASPSPKSPYSRRKSRRGKRQSSSLVKKPEVLKDESLPSHGLEREQRLLYEKIKKELPTTEIVTLSLEDVEPLPEDYDLDDDDYDSDGCPRFCDTNNNLCLREWNGECVEEAHLLSSDASERTFTPSSSETLKHGAEPLSPAPSKTACKKLFNGQEHPAETGQTLQSVLEDIDELFSNHTEEYFSYDGNEGQVVADTPFKAYRARAGESASEGAPQGVLDVDSGHDDAAPAGSNSPKGQSPPTDVVSCHDDDVPSEPKSSKEQLQHTEEGSIIVVDDSHQWSQEDDDDDETQLPLPLSPSTQSPTPTSPSLLAKKRPLVPSTSSATLSDSSQSDFVINLSGDNDFTILKCSIDDPEQKEHQAGGMGDHKEYSDSNNSSDSDSDIFSPPDDACLKRTPTEGEPPNDQTDKAKSSDDFPRSPEVIFTTTESATTECGSNSKDRCIHARDVKEASPAIAEFSRKRKQRIIGDDAEEIGSIGKRIRFADQEQNGASDNGTIGIDMVPFINGDRIWTSTQKECKSGATQDTVVAIISDEKEEGSESAEEQISSASRLCSSGWVSKQDMMQTKRTAVQVVEDTQELESEEATATNSPNYNAGKCRNQNIAEELSPIILSSGSLDIESCAVDAQENSASVKETDVILVSSGGSSRDSNRTADLSVTPVLFSSGESTKAVIAAYTCPQNQTPSEKSVAVTDSGELRDNEHSALVGANQDAQNLDEEEPMSIDTPEDCLSFSSQTAPPVVGEGTQNAEFPQKKFTRIRRVSLSSSGRHFVRETQPESVPSPTPTSNHSSKSSTPLRAMTKPSGHLQDVNTTRVISPDGPDTPTSTPPDKCYIETVEISGKKNTRRKEKSVCVLSSTEHPDMSETVVKKPTRQVNQTVIPSKIYMGSLQMRQLTLNQKKKPPSTQTKLSFKPKNVLSKKQKADPQTRTNSCLPCEPTSRKSVSDFERKTTKDISRGAVVSTQDQDENLPSTHTDSMLNGTHLPSSDDSASSVGEQALLDWCAMYLLESAKR
ncbi:dentin sialophosphoprotein-like isoform X1 [Lytechinus pictus]|uniref:dentin sialophosphoprotein-like isoform X1 n=1 Tax=Lytechinus pictus TaxID=7653 RepID=UPI0030B9E2DC